jgi:formamidopyrimidine-DNA glycosylase
LKKPLISNIYISMPELPEVENVRQSLQRQGAVGQVFANIELLRAGLRTLFPRGLDKKLKGQGLLAIQRRAKFLLFETEDYILISHLGMTGSWRSSHFHVIPEKHDHAILHFESGLKLIFNDPRRFGILELVDKKKHSSNRWLKNLGVEPLENEFSHEFLFSRTRRRKVPIKNLIMDQKIVVGVGNIYASEALFKAAVKPLRPSGRITRDEAERLVKSIRAVLQRAIQAGGSTIRDYRNSEGQDGSFQLEFSVYDRAKKPCMKCGTAIRSRIIGGRNTFWCPKCQR